MKTVLNSLLQIFPQIDMRILKVVANEFPNDVDTAVEFILSDVIPIMSTQPAETSAHVHAPPALVLDANHPPTEAEAEAGAADGNLRAEETREKEANPIAC